jgi:hypothetical protein
MRRPLPARRGVCIVGLANPGLVRPAARAMAEAKCVDADSAEADGYSPKKAAL